MSGWQRDESGDRIPPPGYGEYAEEAAYQRERAMFAPSEVPEREYEQDFCVVVVGKAGKWSVSVVTTGGDCLPTAEVTDLESAFELAANHMRAWVREQMEDSND